MKNPTEEQHEKFLKSFEDLNYGFNNIYLICKKILPNPIFRDKTLDFFFRIILNEHFETLKENFSFKIKKDQKALIETPTQFNRIKYNNKEVTKEEILNLFKEEPHNIESMDIPYNIPTLSNKKMEDNLIINASSNINEIIEKRFRKNRFFNYLIKKQNEYKERKFKTPILDYLIKNKIKLKTYYFRKNKKKDISVYHHYNYLENLLFLINVDSIDFQDNKVGYFCFLNKYSNKYFEGIYSNIGFNFLFEKVFF